MKTQTQLRKEHQETWDSIKGKNNYNPVEGKELSEGYYPEPNPHDLPPTNWMDSQCEME